MKRYLSILLGVLFGTQFFASCSNDDDKDITNNDSLIASVFVEEAGTLSQALKEYDADKITHLTISGKINARDFNYLKSSCTSVQQLNMANVQILSFRGKEGTNEGYNYYYAEDEIPLGAFFYWAPVDEGMPSLQKVVIPDDVVAIRRNAFARAYNLVDINFPEGLKSIDYVAFALCKSLKKITLPSTLGEIGEQAFNDCEKLEEVYINAVYPPTLSKDVFEGISKNAKLIVPKGSYDSYRASSWSSYFEISELN